jgi:hypothetical protein
MTFISREDGLRIIREAIKKAEFTKAYDQDRDSAGVAMILRFDARTIGSIGPTSYCEVLRSDMINAIDNVLDYGKAAVSAAEILEAQEVLQALAVLGKCLGRR